mmetsp:Transcript_1674/g.7312  ORF Transcript_1674/g.7312 Transcript_1674/m.7312 type:complete len:97 (-) Transcript_1674:104-394(-)
MNTRRSPWRRLNQNPHMTRTPRPRRKAESTVAWEPTAFNGMLTGYHDTRAGAARRAQRRFVVFVCLLHTELQLSKERISEQLASQRLDKTWLVVVQ